MALKAIFFDLDGTLLDTAPDFIAVLNQLLIEEHKPTLPGQIIRDTVSNGASALVRLGFGIDDSDANFNRLRERLLALYSQHLAVYTRPFEGINNILELAKQQHLSWGVVTNKPWLYTEPLLKQMPFVTPPDSIICPDHVTHKKPRPEPMLLACKQDGCKPDEAICLGDHQRDIESARNAGMLTIACAYGYIDAGDNIHNWQADHVITHPRDAVTLITHYLQNEP